MKIIFFGSSNYCLPILESLNNNFELAGVITRPESSVKQFATFHRVKVFTPKDTTELLSLKADLESLKPDLAIVADYGLIIPKEIYTIPRNLTLNIHFSKLPKYRGPSPVQYTILEGNKSAWITIIIMDKGIDTGMIIWQKEVKVLDGSETTSDLYCELFSIAASELPSVINKYTNKQFKTFKQLNSEATYTKSFTRKDGFIPLQVLKKALKGKAAAKIERKIRALSPWPGLWTEITLKSDQSDLPAEASAKEGQLDQLKTKKRLKILKAHLEPPASQGDTLRGYHERLVLDEVQLEGKNPVTWKQFQEGYPNYGNRK